MVDVTPAYRCECARKEFFCWRVPPITQAALRNLRRELRPESNAKTLCANDSGCSAQLWSIRAALVFGVAHAQLIALAQIGTIPASCQMEPIRRVTTPSRQWILQ